MLWADKDTLLSNVDDIKICPINVLNIRWILLWNKARDISIIIIWLKIISILAFFELFKLLDLLIVIVGKLLELLNGLLVHIGHVQIVHVESLELLQKYRACILLGFECTLESSENLRSQSW